MIGAAGFPPVTVGAKPTNANTFDTTAARGLTGATVTLGASGAAGVITAAVERRPAGWWAWSWWG